MYKQYYQLKENPFSATSDPAFFYSSKKHSEAFSHLLYGIEQRKGIIVITGEIGTGKTTLCRTLLNRLDHDTKTAFILNPDFSEVQLIQLILHDLDIECRDKTKLGLINSLNDFLITEAGLGNNVVIIIDEAQNLRARQLEQIRLLSNLETEKEKLLQIVLVGQPELMDKLKMTSLRQLNQRVSVRFHIMPLDRDEISDYINHRLKIAQTNGADTRCAEFNNDAVEAIYLHSKGTPRLINILCDRALLAGFTSNIRTITGPIVHKCMREVGQNNL
jgi:general secretion pathway protein A